MRTLAGRIAVVTGATAGVGRGIASELANGGARVVITGRSIHDGAGSASSAPRRCLKKFKVATEGT